MQGITIKEAHTRSRDVTDYRDYRKDTRVHFFIEGENILENLAFRTNRPHKVYRSFLPQVFDQLGVPSDATARWSQKAGCSCGCSPAFILDRQIRGEDGLVCDLYVTLEGEDAKINHTSEAIAEANDRAGQVLADPTLAGLLSTTRKSEIQTGRSGSGNLRNFKAMSAEKFDDVAAAIRSEDNDPEAIEAVNAEYVRRNF